MGNCKAVPLDEHAELESATGSKHNIYIFTAQNKKAVAASSSASISSIPSPSPWVLHFPTPSDLSASYILGQELGRGAYGIVRRCKSLATGEDFACKSIEKRNLRSEKDRERVRQEVSFMQTLSSAAEKEPERSIIKIHEVVEDSESVHLVMELCRGGSISEWLEKRAAKGVWTSEEEAARIMKGLLEALKACHSLGIIHRDVKPANVLFHHGSSSQDAWGIKLTDFGMATQVFADEDEDLMRWLRSLAGSHGFGMATQVFADEDEDLMRWLRSLAGSPGFMAPEVVEGGYGLEADMWSAGAVLYMLLTGRSTVSFLARDHGPRWTSISRSAKNLVRSLLSEDPRSRLTAHQALGHPCILSHHHALSAFITSRASFSTTMEKSRRTHQEGQMSGSYVRHQGRTPSPYVPVPDPHGFYAQEEDAPTMDTPFVLVCV